MFCKHNWTLLSETITESDFEHLIKTLDQLGLAIGKISSAKAKCTRNHIQVFTCEKCGKLKRFVETT